MGWVENRRELQRCLASFVYPGRAPTFPNSLQRGRATAVAGGAMAEGSLATYDVVQCFSYLPPPVQCAVYRHLRDARALGPDMSSLLAGAPPPKRRMRDFAQR